MEELKLTEEQESNYRSIVREVVQKMSDIQREGTTKINEALQNNNEDNFINYILHSTSTFLSSIVVNTAICIIEEKQEREGIKVTNDQLQKLLEEVLGQFVNCSRYALKIVKPEELPVTKKNVH